MDAPLPSTNPLQEILDGYMDAQGLMDYDGLEENRRGLDEYIHALADVSLPELVPDTGPLTDQQLAFWVNLYNVATLQLILDHLPLKSIRDINGPATWDLAVFNVGGQEVSLNTMEHGILRPLGEDPRVHFAINCASISCPPIYPQIFTEANAEKNLEEATLAFVNNDQYVEVDPVSQSVEISQIFSWYQEDFGGFENVKVFIADRLEDSEKRGFLLSYPAGNICLKHYNWNLNIQDPGGNAQKDSDEDGFMDEDDNCPSHPNPSQSDQDRDGRGDDCDTDGPVMCCGVAETRGDHASFTQVGILLFCLFLPALWMGTVKQRYQRKTQGDGTVR